MLCKPEDQGSNPKHLHKKLDMTVSNTALGTPEEGASELQAQRESLSQSSEIRNSRMSQPVTMLAQQD